LYRPFLYSPLLRGNAYSSFLKSIGEPLPSALLFLSRKGALFIPTLLLLAPRFGVIGTLTPSPLPTFWRFFDHSVDHGGISGHPPFPSPQKNGPLLSTNQEV